MQRAFCLAALFTLLSGPSMQLAHADEPAKPAAAEAVPLSEQQLKQLLARVHDAGFYGLRDPEEAKAIAELRKHPDQAAPELTKMLAEGHKNRKQGWIWIYRPMYIIEGMGPAAKVAVPEIAKALNDDHGINVSQSAKLLTQIGPDAKEAMPALMKAWEKAEASTLDARRKQLQKNTLAKAMLAIDPEAAKQAGAAVVDDEEE